MDLQTTTGPARRKWPRSAVRWTAHWVDPSGNLHPGQICDVSQKGVFLRPMWHTADAVAVGATIVVSFNILGAGPGTVSVQGTVRWKGSSYSHQCSGIGIELDKLNGHIAKYLPPEK